MSNTNLDKKLLAEALDAIVNENDIAKATRLFKRHWDRAARNSYSLLESADEDFEINDMGEDFNNEIADEIGSDSEECFNQAQIAIDELEDKFPSEMSDEVKAKFDDLRNILDEMKLAEGDEAEGLSEDASVALEDIKGEFEMNGELDEEVSDLFNEISSCIQGDEASEDALDVADEEDNADDLAECGSTEVLEAEGEADDADVDLEFDESEEKEEEPLSDEEGLEDVEGSEGEEKSSEEVIEDIKYTADDLMALIDELESKEGGESSEEGLEEGWSKISDPRKKATSEEEGVNKKGTMNFGKLRGMSLDKSAGLGVSSTDSKGTAPSTKHKVQNNENNGAKQWRKVEKPANKAASDKSMMGK